MRCLFLLLLLPSVEGAAGVLGQRYNGAYGDQSDIAWFGTAVKNGGEFVQSVLSHGEGSGIWSIMWRTYFHPPKSEMYTFQIDVDDIADVFIDGDLLIHRTCCGLAERSVFLAKLSKYNIVILAANPLHSGYIRFKWKGTSSPNPTSFSNSLGSYWFTPNWGLSMVAYQGINQRKPDWFHSAQRITSPEIKTKVTQRGGSNYSQKWIGYFTPRYTNRERIDTIR